MEQIIETDFSLNHLPSKICVCVGPVAVCTRLGGYDTPEDPCNVHSHPSPTLTELAEPVDPVEPAVVQNLRVQRKAVDPVEPAVVQHVPVQRKGQRPAELEGQYFLEYWVALGGLEILQMPEPWHEN